MRNILVEILCRSCNYHTHIKSHTFVQPALEPLLRQRILENQMFTYTCPRCHEKITFIHNFLYHDVSHQFMIYMGRERRDLSQFKEQFPHFIIRYVAHPDQLRDKIKILEDGLDDQVITSIKHRLMEKDHHVQAIYYHDLDTASSTIWFEFYYTDRQVLKAVTQSVYDRFAQSVHREGDL